MKNINKDFINRNLIAIKAIRLIENHFVCEKFLIDDFCEQIYNLPEEPHAIYFKNYKFAIGNGADINKCNIYTNIFSTGFSFVDSVNFRITILDGEISIVYVNLAMPNDFFINNKNFKDGYFLTDCLLTYDKKFDIIECREYYSNYKNDYRSIFFQPQLCKDEFFRLIKLKMIGNMDAKLILPELFIESVYNFNTDDFKNRIKLLEMILL